MPSICLLTCAVHIDMGTQLTIIVMRLITKAYYHDTHRITGTCLKLCDIGVYTPLLAIPLHLHIPNVCGDVRVCGRVQERIIANDHLVV